MRRSLLVAVLVVGGCGLDRPEPPDLGLAIEALASAPRGAAVATFSEVPTGRWTAVVDKRWRRREAAGEGAEVGTARIEALLETAAKNAGWETHVEIRVRRAEGLASTFVQSFDGLRFHYGYDARGRPDPTTLRFEAAAPKGARSFLRGFWPAGLLGATPWLPERSVREGEVWSRDDLGAELPDDVAPGARIRGEGGARLESVRAEGDETVLDVRLETLLTIDGERRTIGAVEPIRLGIRDRGRATIRARDGRPLAWTLEEDVVVAQVLDDDAARTELTLTVEGLTTER